MSQEKFNKAFVVLLLLFITAVFLAMVWPFLMTILMAAIFSALARPLYRGLQRWFGGRSSLAAALFSDSDLFHAFYFPLHHVLFSGGRGADSERDFALSSSSWAGTMARRSGCWRSASW
jgi:hypothetical protein